MRNLLFTSRTSASYFSISRAVFAVIAVTAILPSSGWAKPEYAETTAQVCLSCHINEDGGDLNTVGEAFKVGGHVWPVKNTARIEPILPVEKQTRSVIGFLHLIAGFMWFGTILYVHILLKPAYAAKGLPRGEVMLGMASMAVVGLTGAILTASRVTGLHVLLESEWGILLSAKIAIYAVMVSSALFVVTVVGPRLKKRLKTAIVPKDGVFDPQTLADFDGKEGRPAYIAFRGKVYDVSASRLWNEGIHFKKHSAGHDVTSEIAKAPHGPEKLKDIHVVGELDPSLAPPLNWAQKVFYVVAYYNLFLVFLAILVIAFWRWHA